jgi:hypothetical protein
MSKDKKSQDRMISNWSYKDALDFVSSPIKVEVQDVYFKILLDIFSIKSY